MGFHKRRIPPVERLKEIRESYSSDREFLNSIFGKADCIIGSDESLEYLKEIEEKCQQQEEY
jgi:hypothetical protein